MKTTTHLKSLPKKDMKKGKKSDEIVLEIYDPFIQNEAHEKRAIELAIANKELAFQLEEKAKLRAELMIATRELAFQYEEKGKRAGELIIANKQLAFDERKKAEEEEIKSFNEDLEKKVIERTGQLELVKQELESFSYSVSHDLRAPLRAVSGYAQILKEDYTAVLDDNGKRLLEVVEQSADKMGKLIDDLLNLSRMGRKEVSKSTVDMNKLVRTVIEEISISSRHNAEIKVHPLLPAYVDYTLMHQVVWNLLSNAIKYSAKMEKPLIEISSEQKGQQVIYTFKDNGVGFDMEYVNKLFGVFQRLHSAKEFEGTGVGLAIVKRIIEKHGGRFWAEGKPNAGAVFYFSLPNVEPRN